MDLTNIITLFSLLIAIFSLSKESDKVRIRYNSSYGAVIILFGLIILFFGWLYPDNILNISSIIKGFIPDFISLFSSNNLKSTDIAFLVSIVFTFFFGYQLFFRIPTLNSRTIEYLHQLKLQKDHQSLSKFFILRFNQLYKILKPNIKSKPSPYSINDVLTQIELVDTEAESKTKGDDFITLEEDTRTRKSWLQHIIYKSKLIWWHISNFVFKHDKLREKSKVLENQLRNIFLDSDYIEFLTQDLYGIKVLDKIFVSHQAHQNHDDFLSEVVRSFIYYSLINENSILSDEIKNVFSEYNVGNIEKYEKTVTYLCFVKFKNAIEYRLISPTCRAIENSFDREVKTYKYEDSVSLSEQNIRDTYKNQPITKVLKIIDIWSRQATRAKTNYHSEVWYIETVVSDYLIKYLSNTNNVDSILVETIGDYFDQLLLWYSDGVLLTEYGTTEMLLHLLSVVSELPNTYKEFKLSLYKRFLFSIFNGGIYCKEVSSNYDYLVSEIKSNKFFGLIDYKNLFTELILSINNLDSTWKVDEQERQDVLSSFMTTVFSRVREEDKDQLINDLCNKSYLTLKGDEIYVTKMGIWHQVIKICR